MLVDHAICVIVYESENKLKSMFDTKCSGYFTCPRNSSTRDVWLRFYLLVNNRLKLSDRTPNDYCHRISINPNTKFLLKSWIVLIVRVRKTLKYKLELSSYFLHLSQKMCKNESSTEASCHLRVTSYLEYY